MHKLILHKKNLSMAEQQAIEASFNARLNAYSDGFDMRLDKLPSQKTLQEVSEKYAIDINLLPPGFEPEKVKLVVSDMDSTLINIECVDEIADFAGVKAEVSCVTEATMRGELDFAESLQQRVKLLAGLNVSALQRVYDERLKLNPGAERMLGSLKQRGIKFALVSGGFTFFTERLHKRLSLDFSLSNTLEIDNDMLTGEVSGDIVGADAKADFLLAKCQELNISPNQVIAIGDGANDLKMMAAAGLGVAYRAKPKVQLAADCTLNHSELDGLLMLA